MSVNARHPRGLLGRRPATAWLQMDKAPPVLSPPPTGATSRRRPPWGAFLIPRPLAVVGDCTSCGSGPDAPTEAACLQDEIENEAPSVPFLGREKSDRLLSNIELQSCTHGRHGCPIRQRSEEFFQLMETRYSSSPLVCKHVQFQ